MITLFMAISEGLQFKTLFSPNMVLITSADLSCWIRISITTAGPGFLEFNFYFESKCKSKGDGWPSW